MKSFGILTVALLMTLGTIQNMNAQNLPVFFPGEYIEYNVSFMGINLGKITITSKDYTSFKGEKVINAKCEMKSNSGIPFVDLHGIFESWFAPSMTHTYNFVSNMKKDENSWYYEQYDIDYSSNKVAYKKMLGKETLEKVTLDMKGKVVDGCSLFFFARQFTNIKKTVKLPTLMNQSISNTILNFHGDSQSIEIDAVKYPVKVLFFDGRAEWEGIYGLKGYFKGWFSDDDARVPIKAQMNVYVGNVDIELVKWKRGTWQPPKGN
jgi:hypothetical protein